MKKITFLLILINQIVFAQVTNEGKPKSWLLNNSEISNPILMPSFDLKKLIEEDNENDKLKDRPFRFGHKFYVDFSMTNSGVWTTLKNGDRIWQIRIKSNGAQSLNFILNDFYLPNGSTLYLYNHDKTDVLGAYTDSQNNPQRVLGTWLVKGDDIYLEYYEKNENFGRGSLTIKEIVHGYRTEKDFTKALNGSGNCNLDVNCPIGTDLDPLKEELKRSVAMMISGGSGFCSGALVNNTANDGTPYFLTANHCYSDPSTWAFRFNWISTNTVCAQTTNSISNVDFNTISGATLRARRANSDFCLVEINSSIPSSWNCVWAGWDRTTNVASTIFGIHHPAGDIMKTCRDGSPVLTNYTTENVWRINDWEMGVTEPGSSGSPLFNENGRIVGQLWRGSAACSGTNDNGGFDEYGRFDTSWDAGTTIATRLREWLDPSNTEELFIDQYPPNIIYAYNAGVSIQNIDASVCGESVNPEIIIRNFGTQNLTSLQVTYSLNGGTAISFNWTGNLAINESEILSIPSQNIQSGSNTFTVSVNSPNGQIDEFTNNNNVTFNFQKTVDFSTSEITITIQPDNYGSETTWQLIDDTNIVIASGGPYTNNNTSIIQETILVNEGCYTFTINDSYGDGLCCDYGTGYYSIQTQNSTTIGSGGNFASQEVTNFEIITPLTSNDFNNNGFLVYPNPSNGTFNLILKPNESYSYQVLNSLGQIVKSGKFNDSINKIELDSYSSGFYVLSLSGEDSKIYSKIKLIKN
jgi:lysyl endopeptidase